VAHVRVPHQIDARQRRDVVTVRILGEHVQPQLVRLVLRREKRRRRRIATVRLTLPIATPNRIRYKREAM
jgi:hypothetical protein